MGIGVRSAVRRLVATACGTLVLAACSGDSMAQRVLFSAVQGQVLMGGQPVAGARVERSWVWKKPDDIQRDTAVTDAEGRFSLPAVLDKSLFGGLFPHEPLIKQTILVDHGGRSHKAWMHSKRNYAAEGELGGRPIRLRCRLEAEPAEVAPKVFGICEIL
jgi:hypothetical protein